MQFGKKVLVGLMVAAALTVSVGAADKKVKAGFIYVGPAGDLGFSYAHEQARLALVKEMPWLETKVVESVPEGKAGPVIDQLVQNEKCDIVFTCSFGFMDETLAAAKKYPKVIFEHCSGFKTADNMGNYFADLYQIYYLDGLMAGAVSKTNKVGYVSSFPIPECIRHIDAFALGVKAINPKATVDVRWISAWYDPSKAREAALALIASGVDTLAFTEDTASIVETAQEQWKAGKKINVFGHYAPMAKQGPDALVSGQLVNWLPMYRKILTDVRDGTWKKSEMLWLASEGAVELGGQFGVPVNPKFVDQLKAAKTKTADLGDISVYDLVMKRYDQMKKSPSGFEPFTGPIKDQKGTVKYAAGAKASIADLMSINYFVDNVIGKTE